MISMHTAACRTLTLGLFVSLAVAGPAAQAAGTQTVTEEILEILRASGTISDSKYEELLERAEAEESARADTAPAAAKRPAMPAGEDNPKDWTVKWSNGTKLQRNDGKFKLKFGGRMMLDFAQISADSDLRDTAAGYRSGNGVEFRRARLFAEGTLYNRFIFKAQYDFAHGGTKSTAIKSLYAGLTDLGPLGTVRVGHMKEDFSLEEMTSSKYIVFMERALPSVFNPGRNTGITSYKTVYRGRLRYALGVFHKTNDQGYGFKNSDDDDTTYHITGRLTGLPYWADGGKKLVHLGFDYSHQFTGSGGAEIGYRQRPEADLAERYVNARDIAVDSVDLFTTEFAANWNSLSLQAEWQAALLDRRGEDNALLWGIYGQVGYFLTGEHRNYTQKYGNFGRTKLKETFDPAAGTWGALELAVRVSYLDLNNSSIQGGELLDFTVGTNWYLWPNVRIMANYVHSKLRHGGDLTAPGAGHGNLIETRFQFDF